MLPRSISNCAEASTVAEVGVAVGVGVSKLEQTNKADSAPSKKPVVHRATF